MPEYESSSVNKREKWPLKRTRGVCRNEYQKRMARKKHLRSKYTILLIYLSARTALPLRYVFFDFLSKSIDCVRTRLDIATVGNTEH